MRRLFVWLMLAFVAGFGAVMAGRVDGSAISAVLGGICALAFSIPVTAVVTLAVVRSRYGAGSDRVLSAYQPQNPASSLHRRALQSDVAGQSPASVIIVPPYAGPARDIPMLPWFDPLQQLLDGRNTAGGRVRRDFDVIGDVD